jgi:hypothetical protein
VFWLPPVSLGQHLPKKNTVLQKKFAETNVKPFFILQYSHKVLSIRPRVFQILLFSTATTVCSPRDFPSLEDAGMELNPVPEFIDPRFRENKPQALVFSH